MNYRHHFHAGNFADVCKHVVLGRLVEAMARKEKGFLYLDTHAGRGRYDLTAAAQGDSLARMPEWPDGIGRILARSDAPPAVQAYVAHVRDFDRQSGHLGEGLRFYPGSPWLVKAALRPQDRMVLCELHPAEKAALASEFSRVPRVSVLELDGYTAVRAQLPCRSAGRWSCSILPLKAPTNGVSSSTPSRLVWNACRGRPSPSGIP